MLHWKISAFLFTNHSVNTPSTLSILWYPKWQEKNLETKSLQKNESSMYATQPVFTCSKSTMETPNNVWNLFKVNDKHTRMKPLTCSGIFVVNFQQISHFAFMFSLFTSTNKCWDGTQPLQSSSKMLNNNSLIWLNVHCTKNEVFH